MATRPIDPYMSFRFKIEINNVIEGGFTEVSGLQVTTEVETFREGGLNSYVYKLPKETTYGNLVLKKGLADSQALWNWHRQVVAGNFKRETITIILYSDRQKKDGQEVYRWSFKRAFPVKWSGPDLKADGNSVAFESLEIVHEGYIDR